MRWPSSNRRRPKRERLEERRERDAQATLGALIDALNRRRAEESQSQRPTAGEARPAPAAGAGDREATEEAAGDDVPEVPSYGKGLRRG